MTEGAKTRPHHPRAELPENLKKPVMTLYLLMMGAVLVAGAVANIVEDAKERKH